MNFLIFDNDLSSSTLINTLLADFNHVTLVTSSESTSLLPSSSSSFLSIKPGDMSNAAQVIQSLSTHATDPYDGILLFNASYTAANNIIQTIQRLKSDFPHIFIFIINEHDENIHKLLKESSAFLPWTLVNCQDLTSSTYRLETKSDPTNHPAISAINLLDFLRTELKTKQYLNENIFLH